MDSLKIDKYFGKKKKGEGLSELEKNAKMSVLQDLHSQASDAMASKLHILGKKSQDGYNEDSAEAGHDKLFGKGTAEEKLDMHPDEPGESEDTPNEYEGPGEEHSDEGRDGGMGSESANGPGEKHSSSQHDGGSGSEDALGPGNRKYDSQRSNDGMGSESAHGPGDKHSTSEHDGGLGSESAHGPGENHSNSGYAEDNHDKHDFQSMNENELDNHIQQLVSHRDKLRSKSKKY